MGHKDLKQQKAGADDDAAVGDVEVGPAVVVDGDGKEVDHVGEYLEIDRPRLLAFTWSTRDDRAEPGRIIIEFTAREGGCDVKLTHVMGAAWSEYVDRAASSWAKMLDALERAIARDPGEPSH